MTEPIPFEDKIELTMECASSALALARAAEAARALTVRIVEIARDPMRDDDGVLCRLEDGRVFVTVAETIRPFAEPGDTTALPAFNRAFERRPDLFRGPLTPRVPMAPAYEGPGFIADLTDQDRRRMYAIIRKHHKRYFADHPTKAQMDNLIEGLGLKVIEAELKRMVDNGTID